MNDLQIDLQMPLGFDPADMVTPDATPPRPAARRKTAPVVQPVAVAPELPYAELPYTELPCVPSTSAPSSSATSAAPTALVLREMPTTAPPELTDVAALAKQVAAHPDYRVLRRLVPCLHFEREAQGPLRQVVVLDTETTGLSHATDHIIELALLRFAVDSVTGLPVGAVQVYDGLEDPGVPISAEVQAITGISDDMVRGQRLDEDRVAALLDGADLVIAHNAGFDRPFCESRLKRFALLPWACSFASIDWKQQGHGSSKLEYLGLEKGWFYDAHRAEMDCHALLAVLMAPLRTTPQTGLAQLLALASEPSYKLQANGAPFEAKDALKARAYRWNAELKVWHTTLANEVLLEAELAWLKAQVYGQRAARVQVERVDALSRYSARAGEISSRTL